MIVKAKCNSQGNFPVSNLTESKLRNAYIFFFFFCKQVDGFVLKLTKTNPPF